MSTPAHRWPTVGICRCGRTTMDHKIRGGRVYADWLAAGDPDGDPPRGGTDDGSCSGYREARREERPPEGEYRRRLAAIVELVALYAGDAAPDRPGGVCPEPECLPCLARQIAAIARGENPGAGEPR